MLRVMVRGASVPSTALAVALMEKVPDFCVGAGTVGIRRRCAATPGPARFRTGYWPSVPKSQGSSGVPSPSRSTFQSA